jgi:AraC-like DNA-binding protein
MEIAGAGSPSSGDPLAGLCAYLLWLGSSEQDGWQRPALRALDFMLRLVDTGPLPEPETEAPLPPALRAAISQLHAEWFRTPLRRVSVAGLAAAAGVSRGYLNRMFRAHFSLSPAEAMERVRCARAENLLTRTDLTAEAIAHQCGYADLSHFSHRFAAVHGLSPTAYRRQPDHAPSVLEHAGVRRLQRLLRE